jgi:hypothetical protein
MSEAGADITVAAITREKHLNNQLDAHLKSVEV